MDASDTQVFDAEEATPGMGVALTRMTAGGGSRLDAIAAMEAHPDPAQFGWPPTLALELAMRVAPTKDICEAYGISRPRWLEIAANKTFIAELAGAMEMLRQDGMAFKARAGLQSLELLKVSWQMIHDTSTPPAVRADLLKYTITAAGLNEGMKKSGGGALGASGGVTANGFHININLGG